MVQVPVGKDFRVSAASVARAITRNTVLVVASSPCFPHGVIDDVEGIAKVSSWLPPFALSTGAKPSNQDSTDLHHTGCLGFPDHLPKQECDQTCVSICRCISVMNLG